MDNNFTEQDGRIYDMPGEIISERKYVSKLFVSLTISSFASYILLILFSTVINLFADLIGQYSFFELLINDMYTIFVILLFVLLTRKMIPLKPIPIMNMTPGHFVSYLLISIFLMMVGAIVGNAVSSFVGVIVDVEQVNVIETVITSYPRWQIIITVMVIAPITEEYLFRKLLIDKTSKYGTLFSVLISGVLFGAFHGNFFQFFYGTLIGCLLAYVYCTYSNLIYCILIHSFVNFVGSIVPLYCTDFIESSNVFLIILVYAYYILYFISAPVGMIILASKYKERTSAYLQGILVCPGHTLKKNLGLAIYIIYTIIIFVISII